MSETVIELFEPVEVEIDQADGAMRLGCLPQQSPRPHHKATPVEQAGQRIMDRIEMGLPHLRQILDHGDIEFRLIPLIANQRHGEVDPDQRCIRTNIAFFQRIALQLAPVQPAKQRDIGIQIIGMGDLLETQPHQHRGRIAGNLLETRIDRQEAAIERDMGNADRRVLEGRLKPALRIGQIGLDRLRLLAQRPRDMGQAVDPADRIRGHHGIAIRNNGLGGGDGHDGRLFFPDFVASSCAQQGKDSL